MSKEVSAYSAVALIEAPSSYIVHKRPNLRGRLAYGDRYQFLGGHRDICNGKREPADAAVVREISEETNLGELSSTRFTPYWQGLFEGFDKNNQPVTRDVACFHLGLTAVENAIITLKEHEGGELIYIPKDPEEIDALVDRLAPFAHHMLSAHVRGQIPKQNQEGYLDVPTNRS